MQCQCVRNHNPVPTGTQTHHVVPQSWMKRGAAPSTSETVVLCGTTHDSVHNLLNEYVRANGIPAWPIRRQYSHFVRGLVTTAWLNKPKGKLPYTTSQGKL
jgi:hypothetical protein